MKTSITLPVFTAFVLPILMGLVIAIMAIANLSNKTLPIVSSPRSVLIAILIIGMTMCALGGISQVGVSGKWASPFAIAGYLLGLCLLVVLLGGIFNWQLPLIANQKQSVTAASILILAKFCIGTIGYFFHLL